MPIVTNIEMTHPGVKIGLQAESSCCVNLEYLGLLDFLLVEEDEAPSLVIDPNLSISTIPFLYNATTPTSFLLFFFFDIFVDFLIIIFLCFLG